LHTAGVFVVSQSLLWQSVLALHFFPLAHGEQLFPPQSLSVSSPFSTASVQVGAVHVSLVASHTLLEQSALVLHFFVSAHLFAHEPPQSTSVSSPFIFVSEQEAVLQILLSQTLLLQSPPFWQAFPALHLLVQEPPQSTSVSPPFFTPSEQLGVAHM